VRQPRLAPGSTPYIPRRECLPLEEPLGREYRADGVVDTVLVLDAGVPISDNPGKTGVTEPWQDRPP